MFYVVLYMQLSTILFELYAGPFRGFRMLGWLLYYIICIIYVYIISISKVKGNYSFTHFTLKSIIC